MLVISTIFQATFTPKYDIHLDNVGHTPYVLQIPSQEVHDRKKNKYSLIKFLVHREGEYVVQPGKTKTQGNSYWYLPIHIPMFSSFRKHERGDGDPPIYTI